MTFHRSHYRAFAHASYVYCLLLVPTRFRGVKQEVLVSGGGDGAIKVWSLGSFESDALLCIHKFKNPSTIVSSLANSGALLYAGLGNGGVHIYNLESLQLVQKIKTGSDSIPTLQVMDGVAFCGTTNGMLKVYHTFFDIKSLLISLAI